MPEVRTDPLSGLHTIVAGDRAARPGGGLSTTPPDPNTGIYQGPFTLGTGDYTLESKAWDHLGNETGVTVAHLIELTREIEGIHDLLARSVGVIVDDTHHSPRPFIERAMRPIRLKFVVLDEVDAGFA